MKFRFHQHVFEVEDRIAWIIPKLLGPSVTFTVYNYKDHLFTATIDSQNFQTKGTNGEIEIEAIEIFGTEIPAAQDHETRDIEISSFLPKISLWNRTNNTELSILGDSALSIMGYPQNQRLKIDSREYKIEFRALQIQILDERSPDRVILMGDIERV